MEQPGRSPEWASAVEAFAGLSRRVRYLFEISPTGQALKAMVNIDPSVIIIAGEGRQQRVSQAMRVLLEDVGTYPGGEEIASGDVGKFWFVVGYSEVGGPDIVRPAGEPA